MFIKSLSMLSTLGRVILSLLEETQVQRLIKNMSRRVVWREEVFVGCEERLWSNDDSRVAASYSLGPQPM